MWWERFRLSVMEQDEFDMELSMLRVGVEDTGPGWGCISPQQSRRLYVHDGCNQKQYKYSCKDDI